MNTSVLMSLLRLCSLGGLLLAAACDRDEVPHSAPLASIEPPATQDATPVDIMDPTRVRELKALLPTVDDAALTAVLQSNQTMWYDAESLKHVYQDSVTPVLGVRANAIGRTLAVDGQLVFDTKERFHFPFGITAGLDQSPNIYIANFWALPARDGKLLPVAYYEDRTTRWRWMFPVGTYFGEVMFLKDAAGQLHAFEIRTRKRYTDGWAVNAYRPFTTAAGLAAAVIDKRPTWEAAPNLRALIGALRNPQTLTPKTLTSEYFSATFDRVDGALDYLPDFGDDDLVKELLHTTPFASAEGKIWKQSNGKETYAASTKARFSIVPRDYEGGLFPVNEVSCNRCHQDTGRQIGEFSFYSLLYGEIWGEDRIFTWHLFDESGNFGGAFDRNRILNRQFVAAGLIERYRGGADHPATLYKELPRRFKIIYE